MELPDARRGNDMVNQNILLVVNGQWLTALVEEFDGNAAADRAGAD